MLSKLLRNVADAISASCPFPVRVGRIIPRLEIKFPVVAVSYAGTVESAQYPWHRVRVALYLRFPYTGMEEGEVALLQFVEWVLAHRNLLVYVDDNLTTATFDLDSYSTGQYIDDGGYVILEAAYTLRIPG